MRPGKRLERFQHGGKGSQNAEIGRTEDDSKKTDKVNARKKNERRGERTVAEQKRRKKRRKNLAHLVTDGDAWG